MALRQFSSSFAQGEFQFLIVFPVVIRTFVPVSGMRTGARPPNRECKQFGLLLSMGMFLGPGRNRIQTGARPPPDTSVQSTNNLSTGYISIHWILL